MTRLYISGHPLDDWEIEARSCATANLADLSVLNGNDKPFHKYCGVVTAVKIHITPRGTSILEATLEDHSGPGELRCFNEMVAKARDLLKVNAVVLVQGDVEENAGSIRVLVRHVIPLQRLRDDLIRKLIIQLNPEVVSPEAIQHFAKLCAKHPGNRELQFNIINDEMPLTVVPDRVKVHTTSEFMKGLASIFGSSQIELQCETLA